MLKRTLIPLICLLAGGTIGWVVRGQKAEAETQSLILLHAMERAGFAANMSTVVDENRMDTLDTLIGMQLKSGISRAKKMVDNGATLPGGLSSPNLREGMARAKAVAEGRSQPVLVERADHVLNSIWN